MRSRAFRCSMKVSCRSQKRPKRCREGKIEYWKLSIQLSLNICKLDSKITHPWIWKNMQSKGKRNWSNWRQNMKNGNMEKFGQSHKFCQKIFRIISRFICVLITFWRKSSKRLIKSLKQTRWRMKLLLSKIGCKLQPKFWWKECAKGNYTIRGSGPRINPDL